MNLNIILFIVSALLLAMAQCDLIGQNRLGNNVYFYRQFRNVGSMGSYEHQIARWISEQNKNVNTKKLPSFQITTPAKTVTHKSRRQHTRRNLYRQQMI